MNDPRLSSLLHHLDSSPSPHHSVVHASSVLAGSGFESCSWSTLADGLPDRGFVADGGLLFAWVRGLEPGFAVVGAHTDSPCLRVKPHPDSTILGWRQIGVEIYGGILNNSWLDRDLAVAGQLVLHGGRSVLVRTDAVARVPQLAVHLDRDVNEKGLVLDRQQHLTPVWGTTADDTSFASWICRQADVDPAELVTWDLSLHDAQPARLIGADADLIASARIDNQVSCWAALEALRGATNVRRTAVVALFDHEEVGSESIHGAAGPRLEWILRALHRGDDNSFHASLASSLCVSADCAHAVHPNYPERHDVNHRPIVNQGIAIKINNNQRYATNAQTASRFAEVCRLAGVTLQSFVSRNNMPCGSTIGPIASTRLGIPTVDVGVPQLSMHSAREMCGTKDPLDLARALGQLFG